MTNDEIVKWLRSKKIETGSLVCLGCGHEHHCGIHGCAIMRTAADAIENLQTENAALRRQIDNLTSAQAVVVKEFETKLEELHEAKSELDAAVRGQETLQKALAEVKAERNWISVNDKLPGEEDELVLAVVSGKPKENIELVGACEFAVYSSSEGWILENWPEWTGAVVTHWMPLPEPPEKET